MKKFFIYLFLIIFSIISSVKAEECIRISSVNYDTASSVIFFGTIDETVNLNKNIKIIKLSNPNRAYFDINNAILIGEKQNYKFSNGDVKEIIVSQNSNNPNIVRCVLYFDEDFNFSDVEILNVKNNIVVKLAPSLCNLATYFQKIYREEKSSEIDFYENMSIFSQKVITTQNKINLPEDKVLNQIQQVFDNSTFPVNLKSSYENRDVVVVKKNLKLNSKYYLNSITIKSNGILFAGIGSVSTERPIILSSPSRLVIDLPNTLVNQNLTNRMYKFNNGDFLRIGQFEANKARIVITTENLSRYIPVHSADNQTILIADKEVLEHEKLSTFSTNITSYVSQKIDDLTEEFTFKFSQPVVHSVSRENSDLILYLYNASQFNEMAFKDSIKSTAFSNMKASLIPKIGIRLQLPLSSDTNVTTFLSADAKSIKIRIKTPKKQLPISIPISIPIRKKESGEKIVIIDPGHGGVDYGAIRAGINEKDIVLDITQRIEAILKTKGIKVVTTRREDKTLSLQERVDIAEANSADLFVSVHVNASVKNEISGIETHYYHDYSIPLAQVVHQSMATYICSKNRGLFKSKFYVINHTTMPAILVEIGFLSNDAERAELISEKRKQTTATAIAEGIINYYKQQK